MEISKPTYDLESFKSAFTSVSKLNATGAAIKGAAQIGFGRQEVVDTIQAMKRAHFKKSMTSYADHRSWQDVYNVPFGGYVIYIKFTDDVITEFRLLSFKEV